MIRALTMLRGMMLSTGSAESRLAGLPPPGLGLPALTFDRVGMTFPDGTEALQDISFDVKPGEFVTVVGPSGCGKSTLLRIASNLTPNTNGTCSIDRSSIGYVFQDATLLQWRTVRRNIELLAELHGHDAATRKQLSNEAIDLVGLRGHENKYPKQLSGGMKMRASLARSLVLETESVPVRRALRRARRDHA